MKILHTISSFRTGGAEKLLIDAAKQHYYTTNEKFNVCIINNEYDNHMLSELEKYANVYLLGKDESNKNIKYIYKFIKLVRQCKIDIIHCHNRGSYKFSIICRIILRRVRLIYTIHDTNIYNNISNIYVKLDKIFVDKFIAISRAVELNIAERGINKNKIELVYNGIDIENYNLKKEESTDEIIIGCVARLVPEKKGQDVLIKAIYEVKKHYPNIKCRFAGDVPIENGRKKIENQLKLQNLVKKLNLDENIEFLGNITDVPKFLQGINIFVLPSYYEGFGLAIIEAISSKTKVIASNIDGPREILKDGKYGVLFEKGNEFDLSQKIIDSIQLNNKNLIDDAYMYVHENYSIKSMYERYHKIYTDILHNKYINI